MEDYQQLQQQNKQLKDENQGGKELLRVLIAFFNQMIEQKEYQLHL